MGERVVVRAKVMFPQALASLGILKPRFPLVPKLPQVERSTSQAVTICILVSVVTGLLLTMRAGL